MHVLCIHHLPSTFSSSPCYRQFWSGLPTAFLVCHLLSLRHHHWGACCMYCTTAFLAPAPLMTACTDTESCFCYCRRHLLHASTVHCAVMRNLRTPCLDCSLSTVCSMSTAAPMALFHMCLKQIPEEAYRDWVFNE